LALKSAAFDVIDNHSYSANIDNLMMTGKHISVTHVGSATKLMGSGAQHGIAVAAAAWLCSKNNQDSKLDNHTEHDALSGRSESKKNPRRKATRVFSNRLY